MEVLIQDEFKNLNLVGDAFDRAVAYIGKLLVSNHVTVVVVHPKDPSQEALTMLKGVPIIVTDSLEKLIEILKQQRIISPYEITEQEEQKIKDRLKKLGFI